MRKLILALVICSVSITISHAQRRNARGEKIVSKVFLYDKDREPYATIFYEYDEKDNLVSIEEKHEAWGQKFVKTDNMLSETYNGINLQPDNSADEFWMDENNNIIRSIGHCYNDDGSDSYKENVFEYNKEGDTFKLVKWSYKEMIKEVGKEPCPTSSDNEHYVETFSYPNGNTERKATRYNNNKPSVQHENEVTIYGDVIDDTNINLIWFTLSMGNMGYIRDQFLFSTSWLNIKSRELPCLRIAHSRDGSDIIANRYDYIRDSKDNIVGIVKHLWDDDWTFICKIEYVM